MYKPTYQMASRKLPGKPIGGGMQPTTPMSSAPMYGASQEGINFRSADDKSFYEWAKSNGHQLNMPSFQTGNSWMMANQQLMDAYRRSMPAPQIMPAYGMLKATMPSMGSFTPRYLA